MLIEHSDKWVAGMVPHIRTYKWVGLFGQGEGRREIVYGKGTSPRDVTLLTPTTNRDNGLVMKTCRKFYLIFVHNTLTETIVSSSHLPCIWKFWLWTKLWSSSQQINVCPALFVVIRECFCPYFIWKKPTFRWSGRRVCEGLENTLIDD